MVVQVVLVQIRRSDSGAFLVNNNRESSKLHHNILCCAVLIFRFHCVTFRSVPFFCYIIAVYASALL